MWAPVRDVTADPGSDLQFGTNVLRPFFLIQLLLPALLRGTSSSNDSHAGTYRHHVLRSPHSTRISILGHLEFETFEDRPKRRELSTEELYNQSKLADVLVAFELAWRYGEQGLVAVALHPGISNTDLMRHISAVKRAAIVRSWRVCGERLVY